MAKAAAGSSSQGKTGSFPINPINKQPKRRNGQKAKSRIKPTMPFC
jgi:hypothetical protein